MSKFVLYAHGGSGNHGCEALVRTTSKIINNTFGEYPKVISSNPDEDRTYIKDLPLDVLKKGTAIPTSQRIKAKIFKSLSGSLREYDKYELQQLFNTKDSICFSIGGDNYCYSDFDYYGRMNRYLNEKGNKTILWGCSVEPELLKNSKVIKDLKRYQLITARESLTYSAMKNAGLEKVLFCPDSAFLLEIQEAPLHRIFESNVVGINLSPMVLEYESSSNIVMKNYIELLNYIIDKTDMNIAFIPHVVWNFSDDLIPLKALYERYKHTNRVALIDEKKQLNCCQLKYIISKCKYLVTARTHASIAGYSTNVPTLVTGYSVKARGIARDIFGNFNDYVCAVQDLKRKTELTERFNRIVNNTQTILFDLEKYNYRINTCFSTVGERLRSICLEEEDN